MTVADAGSNVDAAGTEPVERMAVSPLNGARLAANAETAARARAGKAAKRAALLAEAEAGLLRGVAAVAAGVATVEQAWGHIVEAQAELAATPDARGSTQAASFVGKAVEAIDAGRRDSEESAGAPLDFAELGQLVVLFRAMKAENPELAHRAAQLLAAAGQ